MSRHTTTNASQKASRYSYASQENQWKAFERLPRSVRAALNEAKYSWAPYPIWRRWEGGHYGTAEELVREIRRWDRQTWARDAKKDRFITPPAEVAMVRSLRRRK